MPGQLSFIVPRPIRHLSRPISTTYDSSPCLDPAQFTLVIPPHFRPTEAMKVSSVIHRDSAKVPSQPKETRTIPRSRHSRSPSPINIGADEIKYEPYTITAQGFPVNNKLKKAKYATSIDDRGYLAVYEFALNDQTIMWDYTSGFVHLTGIWKALGNSKADIVRLVENHPELEGVIRRIRGGFLKIQGTWVPFELCKRLALRTCYTIRHALISVFGPDFPDECLKPDAKGYGTLTLDDSGVDKKRKKRKSKAIEDETIPHVVASRASEREKRPRVAHLGRARGNSESSSEAGSFASPTQTSQKTLPPPLPRVLELTQGGYYAYTDLLDLLKATRSLQKLSSGDSADWADQGGLFNLSGSDATFHWDGKNQLELLPVTPPSSKAISGLSEQIPQLPNSDDWRQAPAMCRKFSSSSTSQYPSSVSTNGPVTPPYSYQSIPVLRDVYGPHCAPDTAWQPRQAAEPYMNTKHTGLLAW